MSLTKTPRESKIEFLQEIANGKHEGLNPALAQRCLKYINKVPENKIELEIHTHFLQLCKRESTFDRIMLNLWTVILENKLKTYCIMGKIPEKLDNLVHYKRHLSPDSTTTIESSGKLSFLDHLVELHLGSKFKEFLFRAKEIDGFEENAIYRKANYNNPEGIHMNFMLSIGDGNLIIHYHPALNTDEVSSLLRTKFYWWARK